MTERPQPVVAPGFEVVAAAFAANFAERGEVGASFVAFQHGRKVVDLWGGLADSASGRPWEQTTLVPVFSGTKGLVATCVLVLIDRGLLDLDRPVAAYWPEFRAHDKHGVLVRHVVSHTAGLPGIRAHRLTPDSLLDDRLMAAILADEQLFWPPGQAVAYHPLTFGWLCGELVRRVDGRSVGSFLSEEVCRPLQLEAWIGLDPDEEARVARIEFEPGYGRTVASNLQLMRGDPIREAIWGNPPFLTKSEFDWNSYRVHQSELPGAGGIARPESIARLYGCLAAGGCVDGFRLMSAKVIQRAQRELARGIDPVTAQPMAYGTGFALQTESRPYGPPPDAYGHTGAGGSVHGAWPSHGLGFSYAQNQHRDDPSDARSISLLDALFDAATRRVDC
jgi:CubicO group peptidase (beta-lactamase class C family)